MTQLNILPGIHSKCIYLSTAPPTTRQQLVTSKQCVNNPLVYLHRLQIFAIFPLLPTRHRIVAATQGPLF